MKGKKINNMAASVKQRLLNIHIDRKIDFNFLLSRYVAERFLHRLVRSRYRERFVLKGAMLFYAWGKNWLRPTRDLDFLGFTENNPVKLAKIFKDICKTKGEREDGILFDPETVTAEAIMEEADYPGVRIHVVAYLGKARHILQIDIGFGDAITPGIKKIKYPSILEKGEAIISAYPIETVIAEKIEAIVGHGQENSRMKDFYDLLVLTRTFTLNSSTIIKAIQSTFMHRGTSLYPEMPIALTARYYEEKNVQWQAFLGKNSLSDVPSVFLEVGEEILSFIEPIRAVISAKEEKSFKKQWRSGEKWINKPTQVNIKKV